MTHATQAETILERRESDNQEIERLQARTRELTAFSAHLQTFSEQEKSKLARTLHDELGGLLTAAKMDLSWLQSRIEDATLNQRLQQLGAVLDEAMDLKRRVVEDLRPSLLDHFGLPTALKAYIESTCAKAGLQVQMDVQHACETLPKDRAIALFRVVQEGVTNIIRHARAHKVVLVMAGHAELCSITLTDDGVGFDSKGAQFGRSHGLMGMGQRIHALHGRMDVESRPGAGTTLRFEVPVEATAHSSDRTSSGM